jgi:hypothetical protein
VWVQPVQAMVETSNFKGTLLDHQQRGVGWMLEMHAQGVGHVLADEVGLGRTVSHLDDQQALIVQTQSFVWSATAAVTSMVTAYECHFDFWCGSVNPTVNILAGCCV